MSENMSKAPTHTAKEHGTMTSYVVGFILSLIFTAIPYYMVVNKTASHDTLVIALLVFAVIQMLIQIIFFLHIGRGPKPLYNVAFYGATVVAILVVVCGSIFIMNHLYGNMNPMDATTKLAQHEGIAQVGGKKTGACDNIGENHKVFIKDGVVTPSHTEAQLCDSLSFINQDSVAHEMAFGTYPNHELYGGESGPTVRSGRPETITLNQTGDYTFHDHHDESVSGTFTVKPQQ